MGGYAVFIWAALLITAAVMIGLLVISLKEQKAGERKLRQLEARLPRNSRAARGRKASDSDQILNQNEETQE
ncbi:heme exporter protein CcmD [Limibacillus halophilus]|uniref:Heme exporter protein D n=1 Tax=Limibacillus halophilus TaxID=1579333 RepID=A0A839SU92_9PROT|nr:heme exporter protein CcmD [Limibacillus halophilus]MBB3066387.1 heme exporter protein CcmD [Limibacillus halophilus]